MTKNTADPVGTLTIGNVVSASITLYKSNFKRYFQVSLRATAWGVAMVVSMIPFLILGGFLIRVTNPGVAMIPLVLVWFVFALYCLAKYATDRATISRLAYQELIDQPETITVATQALAPRTWAFLRLSCLIGIYMFLVFIVGYILLIIAFGLGGAMLAMLSLTSNPLAIIISAILGIIVFILWILAMIRYYSYWFIAELPLAVESTNSARVCLRRSKTLSLMAVSRLQLIIFIAFLITLPISTLGNVPSIIGQLMFRPTLVPNSTSQSLAISLLVGGFFLGMITELFIMPFWQAVKAVIYYDLRNRREGRDLIL